MFEMSLTISSRNSIFVSLVCNFYYHLVIGGRHSSVVSDAPTILQSWVRIPSEPSMLFSILNVEIVSVFVSEMRKGRN